MEQLTGSKLGRRYDMTVYCHPDTTVYCHPAYLTYVQSTSCEMPDWMNYKLESVLKEINPEFALEG